MKSNRLSQVHQVVEWCPTCAAPCILSEIKFVEKKSRSVYVKFDLTNESVWAFPELGEISRNEGAVRVCILVETLNPWVLPFSLGISLHSKWDYVAIKVPALDGTEIWIVAQIFQEAIEKFIGFEKHSLPLLHFQGGVLHRHYVKHPFFLKNLMIILSDQMGYASGTGAVLINPGLNRDDYQLGLLYGLRIDSLINDQGRYTVDFPEMEGQSLFQANDWIISNLQDSGIILLQEDVLSRYLCCCRCDQPIILR